MGINGSIFCLAYLQWCHNGRASNISIVVDNGYTHAHPLWHHWRWAKQKPKKTSFNHSLINRHSHLFCTESKYVNTWFSNAVVKILYSIQASSNEYLDSHTYQSIILQPLFVSKYIKSHLQASSGSLITEYIQEHFLIVCRLIYI